jgi:hypothetical protein
VPEGSLRVLHWDTQLDPDAWVDITSSLNTITNVICGVTDHLSPFVIGAGSLTGVGGAATPAALALRQNVPNPFNPSTTITYDVPDGGSAVAIRVYDAAGRLVRTQSADWAPRPGHQAAVLHDTIVLFGGFGLSSDPANPFAPANPMDIWVSKDGASWNQVSDSPWNAATPAEIKYDFAAVVAPGSKGGPAIYTFGGDRETCNFQDPTNYLNVDNDVWRFSPPIDREPGRLSGATEPGGTSLNANVPNPFNPTTTISFELAASAQVSLRVYSVSGAFVRTLVEREMSADQHQVVWDGRDENGAPVSSGVYFYRLTAGGFSQTRKMLMIK